MTSTKCMGMDVHKQSISIAVMSSVGKVVMECVIETKASTIFGGALASAQAIRTSIRTLWNNQSRWNTQRITEECLVATQPHYERHSCSLFSA